MAQKLAASSGSADRIPNDFLHDRPPELGHPLTDPQWDQFSTSIKEIR